MSEKAREIYETLKSEIRSLHEVFNKLHSMPTIKRYKEIIWETGHRGGDCVSAFEWLGKLQRAIAKILVIYPIEFDTSRLESVDEQYRQIKEYYPKLIDSIEKHLDNCGSALSEKYGVDYNTIKQDFEQYKHDIEGNLEYLKSIESAEEIYWERNQNMTKTWEMLMLKCEELQIFADFVLIKYDPIRLNWKLIYWDSIGRKEVTDFINYTLNRLDEEMSDNKYLFESEQEN